MTALRQAFRAIRTPCACALLAALPIVVFLSACAAAAPHRGGASFVAGTAVLTPEGPRAIETLGPGGLVQTWDFKTGEDSTATLGELRALEYNGDLITVDVGGVRVTATGGHPFWVSRGTSLEERAAAIEVPLAERAGSARGRWVEARDLRSGDLLLARGGHEIAIQRVGLEHKNLKVFNLKLAGPGAFAVGAQGLVVAAYRDFPAAHLYGGGGCFPAGTRVWTARGAQAIETFQAGMQVTARNPASGWSLNPVEAFESHSYAGELVRIRVGGSQLEATGNHPFWVLRGAGLESRPGAADVPLAERSMTPGGRWVQARDLRRGDVLLVRGDGELAVRGVSRRLEETTVYNLRVPGAGSYAVGPDGILVHNKGSAEKSAPPPAGAAPMAEEAPRPPASAAEPSAVPAAEPVAAAGRERSAPGASGLSAGYSDDNAQFNYYLGFQKQYGAQVNHLEMNVEERIVLRVRDANGKSLPNAVVTVSGGSQVLCRGLSHADGSFYFYPSEYARDIAEYAVTVEANRMVRRLALERTGRRTVEVAFDTLRPVLQSVPLDILFVFDTTGSMGEEIERLKATLEIIHLNLSSLKTRPTVRFGMVLYRDRGDEYTTRVVPFTEDAAAFQRELNKVSASGGGDAPEDLQMALRAAMQEMAWNRDGVRLGFILTDAPPHLDYREEYTYVSAARQGRERGIKLCSVGSGGLDLMGEYVLRQIAQYTGGRYIFVTYGETGESEGGAPGSVSHHTGANYETDKLEAIIIRFAKEELQYLSDQPVEETEDYFQAVKVGGENKEETLRKLFARAATQLVDYSGFRIPRPTRVAVLPFNPGTPALGLASEYFTEQLLLVLDRDESLKQTFRTVERKDLQGILKELEVQLSGLVEDEQAARVGALLGAEMLFSGTLYGKDDQYQLFLKLLRVETGEVLSVTKAVIDRGLGL